ncbi:MAG: polysaccharide pyruvyl transferase family protein [Deltaproteobacteria bacterium]|nr:polysaccharide pyruvyl transferase family protein [Deltaproteobacteria bacterium]
MKKLNVVLGDCYHDSDKGGGGIISGALVAIKEVCQEREIEPQITLLYRFSQDDPRFATASRLTKELFPEVSVAPALLSTLHGPHIFWALWAIKALILGPLTLLFPSLNSQTAVLKEADLIILKGGHFYRTWSKNPLLDAIAIYLLTYNILFAYRLGKPLAVLSHSFGPFQTPLSKRLFGWIISKASYLSTREEISKTILQSCAVPGDKINVTPDLAFAAFAKETDRIKQIMLVQGLKENSYIIVTARPWFFSASNWKESQAYEAYTNALAELCRYTIETKGKTIVLVVQNDGAHSKKEPDILPLKAIQSKIARQEVVLIEDDLNAAELIYLYQRAFFTLGTRLHSCIFSFTVGTPCIAVAYTHKADGIMKMMEAAEFVLDINNIDLQRGKAMIDTLSNSRPELSQRYYQRAGQLRAEVINAMHTIFMKIYTVHKIG